jgi:hypothetical protein
MAKGIPGLNTQQKRFVDVFLKLTHRHQSWQAWSDFITMSACALSNKVDSTNYEKREAIYMDTTKRYDDREQKVFPELLAAVVDALDNEPEQDFLGVLFQLLELSSHWHGQFFTPYSVCRMMGDMQMGGMAEIVKEKGYASVNDPACGAGALLIAFANAAKARGINYQDHVLFVAQDIDRTAALMCYIQLSLLGCPGYVVVADTLRNPVITTETEVWYTPMYNSQTWSWRRTFGLIDALRKNEHFVIKENVPEVVEQASLPIEDKPEKEKILQLTLF